MHHAPHKIAINASFAMKLPSNMTIEDLQKTLKTGEDPGHLNHAFVSFVNDIVQHLNEGDKATTVVVDDHGGLDDAVVAGGSLDVVAGVDSLDHVASVGGNTTTGDGNTTTGDGNTTTGDEGRRSLYNTNGGVRGMLIDVYDEAPPVTRHKWRRLEGIHMDPNSVEIYDYVESACPGAEEENGNTSATKSGAKCVTALGKYKIDVDEDEEKKEGGLQSIYDHAQQATKEAIDSGELEKKLQDEPDGNMFHVEGHGMYEDVNFNPYAEVEDEMKKDTKRMDIIFISIGVTVLLCLCCVLCFVELEQKTRPRSNGLHRV
jgi:hypothetical protein